MLGDRTVNFFGQGIETNPLRMAETKQAGEF
jgi:hypothetical protein